MPMSALPCAAGMPSRSALATRSPSVDSCSRTSRSPPAYLPCGVGAALERRGDVAGDLADRLVADDLGVGQGRVDGVLDLLQHGVLRDQVGVARRHPRRVGGGAAGDLAGRGVVGQQDLADVRAVRAGLHHRPRGLVAAGDGLVEDVLLVGVPVEDRVDVRVEVGHLGELPARRERVGVARRHVGAGVEAGHQDVGLAVGGVAVAELVGDAVDRGDRVAEVEVVMPPGLTRLGVSCVTAPITATSTSTPVDGELGVLRQDRRGGALLVDVRRRGSSRWRWRRGRADDPVAQVRPALVELVVAHGRGVHADLVHHVDRRLVVGHGRGERRGADEVAGADDQRVGGRRVGLRAA